MIRELKVQDRQRLLEIRSLIEEEISNKAFFNWPEPAFLDEIKHSEVWVFERSQLIEAFLFFRSDEEHLEIMLLGTDPCYRKNGAMIEILQNLQVFAAEQNKGIRLEVHEHNEAARKLYLKLGFKFVRVRKSYYKDGAGAELYLWKKTDPGTRGLLLEE